MKIEMIKSAKGSDVDAKGISKPLKLFVAGEQYDLGESLAKAFIGMGVAKKVEAHVEPKPIQKPAPKPLPVDKKDKGKGAAPENKGAKCTQSSSRLRLRSLLAYLISRLT